ncbi:MAG: cysteine desulfurase [bacterium]|nr:cysteine desulfurase [bacterium]
MIYLDHHATTPIAPEALEAMLPLFGEYFANAGSTTHAAGRQVAAMVNDAVAKMAGLLGADPEEIVITSGATESNNLAVLGTCLHSRQKRRKIVSLVSEHQALLGPLQRLQKGGFQIELLQPQGRHDSVPGMIDLERLSTAIDEDTALVSVMLANNEIGVVQPLAEIAKLCRQYGALLHTDAAQAVGRIPVHVDDLDVDLLSFSAHKFYGPKGIGGLYVRRRERRVRLQSQIVGGGQQHNLRSGTLNSPAIVGMARALEVCSSNLEEDALRITGLRDRLFQSLARSLDMLRLNGPRLEDSGCRLPGNLNCCFYPVEGQSLMLAVPELAASSGSACTSAEPAPSHVLQAIGLSEDEARSSLRFGIGRFNTQSEIDQVATWLVDATEQLRALL